MKIGEKIKKLREFRNYTQSYVAEKLKMTQAGYSRFERNEVDIPFSKLQKIATALEMPLDKLINFDDHVAYNTYINDPEPNTTESYIPGYKKVPEGIEQQYKERIQELKEEIKRLHVLLEKVMIK